MLFSLCFLLQKRGEDYTIGVTKTTMKMLLAFAKGKILITWQTLNYLYENIWVVCLKCKRIRQDHYLG